MKNRIGAYVSWFGWRFGVFHDKDTLAVYYKIFGVKKIIDRAATTRGAVAAARQKWGADFMKVDGVERRITREGALRLHREMWTDMQRKLGDNPPPSYRFKFKRTWVITHGYSGVECFCFLCEYAGYDGTAMKCHKCPIDWTTLASDKNDKFIGTCCASRYVDALSTPIHKFAPISEILALPERSEQT